jgi:hypothetical protein
MQQLPDPDPAWPEAQLPLPWLTPADEERLASGRVPRPPRASHHLQVLRARHGPHPLVQAAQDDTAGRQVDARRQGGGGGDDAHRTAAVRALHPRPLLRRQPGVVPRDACRRGRAA